MHSDRANQLGQFQTPVPRHHRQWRDNHHWIVLTSWPLYQDIWVLGLVSLMPTTQLLMLMNCNDFITLVL